EDEEKHATLVIAVRGERAWLFETMEQQRRAGRPFSEGFFSFRSSLLTAQAEAWLLPLMAEFLDACNLPEYQQRVRFRALESRRHEAPVYAKIFFPEMSKIAESYHRGQAMLHCARAAVAAERYRLANGHWPDRLEQLLPVYLSEIPTDPFNGLPIKFRK